GEAAEAPGRLGGRPVVRREQAVAVEDRALHDREPRTVLEHLPHLGETGQRPRVVLLQAVDGRVLPQLAVERVGVGHGLEGERVVGDHRPRRYRTSPMSLAQRTGPTSEEYAGWRERFCNWGRWGDDDEL